MTLIPKISFKQNDPLGKIVELLDTTGSYSVNNEGGYGSPNLSYSDAYARIRVSDYNSFINTQTLSQGTLLSRKEYIKTNGSNKTYQGVSIGVGNTFVPTANTSILSGDTFIESGFYVPLILSSRWQPNADIPLYLNGNELGLNTIGIVPDTIIQIDYQIYGAILTNPTSVDGRTYLVQSVTTYNGNTYQVGNVFTALDSSSIVGTVSPFVASYFNVFQTSFNVKQQLKDLVVSNILNPKPKQDKFNSIISGLYARINAIEMNDGLENVSLENAYKNLQDISFTCNNLSNGLY